MSDRTNLPSRRKTPLEKIDKFLQRQNRREAEAGLDERLMRVRLALFGCAPK
jgi:hypothetical protein